MAADLTTTLTSSFETPANSKLALTSSVKEWAFAYAPKNIPAPEGIWMWFWADADWTYTSDGTLFGSDATAGVVFKANQIVPILLRPGAGTHSIFVKTGTTGNLYAMRVPSNAPRIW